VAGSREGRIVLVNCASLGARENGGRFTVKIYHSEKTVTADGWRRARIQFQSVNPAFEPITLEPEDAYDLMTGGEFCLTVLPKANRGLAAKRIFRHSAEGCASQKLRRNWPNVS
jgi:hypothetical protein